jgi:hypothetical protein
MKWTNVIAGLLLFSLHASGENRSDPSFTQALTEADRLCDTAAGKAYDGEFGKVVAPRLGDIVRDCTRNLGPKINFQVVFVFGLNGKVQQVLTAGDQPAAVCVGDKLRDLQLPAPPHAGWPVKLSINIGPDNAPTLLTSALKLMSTGTWEVDATISHGAKMRVHGLLKGEDFDLTLEPEGQNAVRQIALKDKIWVSYDGGKTWKLEVGAEQATFRRVYNFVHDPIRPGITLPALEVADQQKHDGETWMHLRQKISDKNPAGGERMEYWIAISQDSQRNGVRRYEGPVTEPGHEKEPLHCAATYQPANDKTIQPPSNGDSSQKKESGESASPDSSFAVDSLKYSRDFYSKIHLVAIANISFGPGGTVEFKYDRYPNGGPERIQAGDGEFARKNGKDWLKSNDWGETGKPVDAQTSKRLNNWIGLINARLNGEAASNDSSEGATVLKFVGKEADNDREELVFEESKEKPKSSSYPRISFTRSAGGKDRQGLLSHFVGPIRLGAREAMVKISFSHLVAVNIQETAAASPPQTSSPAVVQKTEASVSLLDGKLQIDVPPDFVRESNDPKEPKTLAKFSREDGAWGAVLRGTHGLTPDQLDGYLKMRVAEYSKGFSWLPKGTHLQWLRKDIVVIEGRKWADWRYVPVKGKNDYRNSPVYTRFLTTSYKGQLLEINFTSNLNMDPELKKEIDRIMESVHLEE